MTRLVFVLMTMTAGASALIAAPAAQATTYYIGNFTKCAGVSCPAAADDGSCGASHPCATLAYWSQNRRSVLATGDTVRLTGVFGPSSNSNHCIMPTNAANVTYEGRNADDTSATGFG